MKPENLGPPPRRRVFAGDKPWGQAPALCSLQSRGSQAKAAPSPVFVNETGPSQARVFTSCLRLLLCCRSRGEQVRQRPSGPQSLSYLLSGLFKINLLFSAEAREQVGKSRKGFPLRSGAHAWGSPGQSRLPPPLSRKPGPSRIHWCFFRDMDSDPGVLEAWR